MGILITIIAILVLLLILGVGLETIAILILGLLELTVGLMGLFFSVCLALFALSQREDAEYTGMDDSRGYKVAVYKLSDGEILHNIFPAEMSFVEYVYCNIAVRISVCRIGKRKFAIDGHSLFIIIFGFCTSIPITVFIAAEITNLLAKG